MCSVSSQGGRAPSQEPRFDGAQLHRGQPALLPGLHVALQSARVRPEAPVRQDPLIGGVREASEPSPSATAQRRQDGRPQPQPHGGHPRHDSCPEQGRLNRLAWPLLLGEGTVQRRGGNRGRE